MTSDSDSRFSGFYRRTIEERIGVAATAAGMDPGELATSLAQGGLDAARADKIVENVLGTYALPFAVAVHVVMNGRPRLAPMVVEEPSVVAAVSAAARLVAQGGGFTAEADDPVMIAQVQVLDIADPVAAASTIERAKDEILSAVDASIPGMVKRGGGARGLEVRTLAGDMIAVHLLIDCRDAMGANLLNTAAERVGPRVAELAGGRLGLRILSNLAVHRRVRVRCAVPARALSAGGLDGVAVADAVEAASRFAEVDPFRATTHNKGIMNGIDPVVIATGNDWRAVEAGAHAFASLQGTYRPLATWRRTGSGVDSAHLQGSLELPMALGVVGGTSGVHPAARAAMKLAQVTGASDLAMLAGCVGLASNLAALKALGTEGIQRGHMSLHARSVAISVGASGDEVEAVAREISAAKVVNAGAASDALARLRSARAAKGDG